MSNTNLKGTWKDDAALLEMCERAREEGHDEVADLLAEEVIAREVERDYEAWYDGEGGDLIRAFSSDDALGFATEAAKDDVLSWGWEGDESRSTVWVDVLIRCIATGEEATKVVAVDPPEPECEPGRQHDWQKPHEILGGLKENPGVWGHGGGVTINSVCIHCGCGRTHDTWAQRPSNGVVMPGGSTSYEPGRYAEEIAALSKEEEE